MSEQQSVSLESALQYTIFTGRSLFVHPDGKPMEKAELSIVDITDDAFTAQMKEERAAGVLDTRNLVGLLEYKRQLLRFDVQVRERRSEGGRILVTFTRPRTGVLSNRRRHPRIVLDNQDLRTTIDLESRGKTTRFSNVELHGFSPNHLSLFLDRSEGRGVVFRSNPDLKSKKFAKSHYLVIHIPSPEAAARDAENCARGSQRVSLMNDQHAFVRFPHPFSPEQFVLGSIVDISTSGLSFLVSQRNLVILPGMLLKLEIQLPFSERLSETAEVRFVQGNAEAENGHYRVGVQLRSNSIEYLKPVNRIRQSLIDPALRDAGTDDYEQLWELFFESGFIYQKKRENIQEFAPKLFNTYRKLLSSDTPILKKMLYKVNGSAVGHLSAIKFFDESWIVQHLNAIRVPDSPSAAQPLLKAVTEFFVETAGNELADNHFGSFFYRPDNLYPSLVFGTAKERIGNPAICNTFDLEYSVLTDEAASLVPPPCDSCRTASMDDCYDLEELLITKGYHHLVRVESLRAESMRDLRISRYYEDIGLYRSREVLAAEQAGARAYAVCNLSSAGLNLSELTNSVRIFYSTDDADIRRKLADGLSKAIVDTYARSEMPRAVLLSEPGDPIPRVFENQKVYRYWHLDLKHCHQFKEAVEYVFRNLKALLKEHSRRSQAPDAKVA